MPLNKKPDPAAAPAPEEKSKHGIWDIPLVRIIVAVFCAIITWFVVTMYFDQEGNVTVMVDEISYTYQASTYTSLGLDLVETPQTGNISVRVEGSTTVIGPGQNRAASRCSASGTARTKGGSSCREAMCTISGLSLGRPLAA